MGKHASCGGLERRGGIEGACHSRLIALDHSGGRAIAAGPKTVVAYTDGGCFGNPGPGAWAYLLKWPDGREESAAGGHAKTTNNREELKAIREALRAFQVKVGDSNDWKIVVRSDSEYAIRTVSGRYKRNANLDLFPEIDALRDKRVSFEYVPGHAGSRGNNRVHDLVQAEIARVRSGKAERKRLPPRSDGRRVIRRLGGGDASLIMEAAGLFDQPPRPAAIEKFLADPNHHLLIAYLGEDAAGFVTGVEMTHPDKGTEMFLYEMAVDEEHRRQGIGKALVQKLGALARERGCYGMWVLTETTNVAALATYRSAGGKSDSDSVLFEWTF